MSIKIITLAAAASTLLAGAAVAQSAFDEPSTADNIAPGQFSPGPLARPLSMKPSETPAHQLETRSVTVQRAPTQGQTYDYSSAPSATTTSSDVSATGLRGSASFESSVIASGPVPDTRENRRRYGGPMSNAGRMTVPRGN